MQPAADAPHHTQPAFDLATVAAAIAPTRFAGHLHHLSETTSTQTLALAAAQAGIPTGAWIADAQTAGRGRGNHTWLSAPGAGIHLSALVSPPIPLPATPQLSILTGLAAQAAIAETTTFRIPAEIDLRWPNDLILHHRKVGGILIESTSTHGPNPRLRYAIIGIGINCNQLIFPPELDPIATSLRRESPDPNPLIPREPLLAAILRHLDRALTALEHNPLHALPPDLEQRSTWLRGKRVQVPEDGGYTGITAGLTPEGFLQILADDQTLRTVRSGGVRELRP